MEQAKEKMVERITQGAQPPPPIVVLRATWIEKCLIILLVGGMILTLASSKYNHDETLKNRSVGYGNRAVAQSNQDKLDTLNIKVAKLELRINELTKALEAKPLTTEP